MSKKLLISDANIIIDIAAGNLVEAMFSLHYVYCTPDILYAEELEEQHSDMLAAGLQLYELSSASVDKAFEYLRIDAVRRVSANDCMALALAQQEQCALLTGDARLKQLASAQGVTVRGTLWLVESMIHKGHISVDEARFAYQMMLDDGSRLPIEAIKNQLKRFDQR